MKLKKHKDNIKSKNLCDGCREEFPTKYNKYWHEKSCEIIQILNRRIFKRIVREQNLIDNTKI
jgi:hypothetical protein